jgi:hypothetical protein
MKVRLGLMLLLLMLNEILADITVFYAQRQCAEYGKLGLMGTTILYSSGDEGVAGHGELCLNPDGSQSSDGTRFNRNEFDLTFNRPLTLRISYFPGCMSFRYKCRRHSSQPELYRLPTGVRL